VILITVIARQDVDGGNWKQWKWKPEMENGNGEQK